MKTFLHLIFFSLFLFSCNQKSPNSEENSTIISTDTLKQKDGSILSFQKKYSKNLVFLARDTTSYSDNYKKRIRKVAEYYLSVTKRSSVIIKRDSPEAELGFSMEENDWEGTQYTQIAIFNKVGSNASTLQWLFYEPKSQKLYEFDLNTKKLEEVK